MTDIPKHPGHLHLSNTRVEVRNRYVSVGKTSSSIGDNIPSRSSFTRDENRVIFSKKFRVLNDKTQVMPLVEDDHTHTRLIHSLEVASVARSIVTNLTFNGTLDLAQRESLCEIVRAAALAHDIGNPPFGHGGEDAFRQWWANYSKNLAFPAGELIGPFPDFDNFEGNAMGFAILSEMGLTEATLMAYSKYTALARNIDPKNAQSKKNGFLEDHEEIFNAACISSWPDGNGHRQGASRFNIHPTALIVEAADGICYNIMDAEDCYRHGIITEDKAKEYMISIIRNIQNHLMLTTIGAQLSHPNTACADLADEILAIETPYNSISRIEAIRSLSMHTAILYACYRFCYFKKDIFRGSYNSNLLAEHLFKSDYQKAYYRDSKVVSGILKGSEAINIMMNSFVSAALWKHLPAVKGKLSELTTSFLGKHKRQNEICYLLLPETTRTCLENIFGDMEGINPKIWVKECVTAVAFYVFGMTDSYAIKIAKSLKI